VPERGVPGERPGQQGTRAAPAVRQIWDGIYGLEGHKAAVPGGQVPSSLPQVTSAGTITPPSGYAASSQADSLAKAKGK